MMDRYAIQTEDVMYVDLVNAGWLKAEAAFFSYKLSYFDKNRITKYVSDRISAYPGISHYLKDLDGEEKVKDKKIKELEAKIASMKATTSKEAEKAKEVTENSLRTKSGMLDYLIELAATPGLDTKTKADLAKQITDLQQYKKEDIKEEEDNRIFFFLPLTCAKCSLYKEHKNKKNNNTTPENDEPTENLQQ